MLSWNRDTRFFTKQKKIKKNRRGTITMKEIRVSVFIARRGNKEQSALGTIG